MCMTTRDEIAVQRNEITRLKRRVTALEKRVPAQRVLTSQQEAFASALVDLGSVIETLAGCAGTVATDTIARVCLAGHVPLEHAVELAVKHFCQSARDLRAAESHLNSWKGSSKGRSVLEDHCTRFRAIFEERRRLLNDLRVSVIDVRPGDPVDLDVMLVCDEIPTDNAVVADTVAHVHCPAFRYRDALATNQLILAEVDVFSPLHSEAGESADSSAHDLAIASVEQAFDDS